MISAQLSVRKAAAADQRSHPYIFCAFQRLQPQRHNTAIFPFQFHDVCHCGKRRIFQKNKGLLPRNAEGFIQGQNQLPGHRCSADIFERIAASRLFGIYDRLRQGQVILFFPFHHRKWNLVVISHNHGHPQIHRQRNLIYSRNSIVTGENHFHARIAGCSHHRSIDSVPVLNPIGNCIIHISAASFQRSF